MNKVAHVKWRDHQEAQRYALRQHPCRLPRPSRVGAHPKSKEEAPNYNATTDGALIRPAASGKGWPRASIESKSGQRSRFATSDASSLLGTIHQQLKIHRANLLFSISLSIVFAVQEETIVTLATLITAS
jgi:hypothetical protein